MCQPSHQATNPSKTNTDNDTDTGSGGDSGSSHDDIGARTGTRARSRTRTTTSGPKRPFRTATRAGPRRHRMVIYERNNDRHIQDLDQVVALLAAGTTRARTRTGARARAGAGAGAGAGDVSEGAVTEGRETLPINTRRTAIVTANANTTTASAGTGNEGGDGNSHWDIEVRKPPHTSSCALHPPINPLITPPPPPLFSQLVHHSDHIDPCVLHRTLRDADLFLTTHSPLLYHM